MAEAERLERSQPFGLAALAEPCCTIEPRFQFGAPTRTQTETPKATVFETAVYVVPP